MSIPLAQRGRAGRGETPLPVAICFIAFRMWDDARCCYAVVLDTRAHPHMADALLEVPAILDIEASGFGAGSYPIEVGYVFADASSYCTLIRPASSWTHWDAKAEAMHRISRDTLLRHGRDPSEVARELNQRLDGKVLYTDGWGNDFVWLGRLFDEAALIPRFRVESLRGLLSDAEAANWHATKERVEAETPSSRHRASADAQVLQRALLRVKGMQARGASA
jgi:hypothetical protein